MLRTALALLLMSTILIAAPRGRGKAKADPVAPKIDSKFVHAKTFTPDGKIVFKTTKDAAGKEVKLSLHMFYPAGYKKTDTRPVIVFFFGGGWNSGSPSQFYPHARHFASRGFVCASAEYRVFSRHKTKPSACVEDGRDAVRYLRKNAATLGIDPEKIVSSGGSAGGHVAACTGTVPVPADEDNTISARPCAMILFNPVIDTSRKGFGNRRFSGLNWKLFSPADNITKKTPPTILFHGTKDTTVRFANAERFTANMKKLDRPCTLVAAEGQAHGFFNYHKQGGVYFCEHIAASEAFLIGLKLMDGPALTPKQVREQCFSAEPARAIQK
ncbi:MAG: alpha/beta hydrolase [Phycisphaerales bacterium]|nr:alpha/beta hydrolase [Phycisphaerales bacterium]